MRLACPSCRATDVHHSRPRSSIERLRRWLTGTVPFRCYGCGWRGWLREVIAAPDGTSQAGRGELTDAEIERLEPDVKGERP